MIPPSTNDNLPTELTLRSIELGLDRLEPDLAKLAGGLKLAESLAQTGAAWETADATKPDELHPTRLGAEGPTAAALPQNEDRARAAFAHDERRNGSALVQIHDAIRARSDELPPPFGVPPEAFPGLLPSAAGAAEKSSDIERQPRDLLELAGRLDQAAPRGAESAAGKFDREIRDGVASLVHEGVKIKNPEAFDRQARFV
ncbi:MAG: hypothetical protein ACYC35_05195 [Pirellulales bacterium]